MAIFAYTVRCNFAPPEFEASWHEWYNGHKVHELVNKPQFLAGQRFAASGLDQRRKYLALWFVSSPEAFATPEYRADWGFKQWTPHITDWSRDLFAAPPEAQHAAFDVGTGEALYVIAADGLDAEAARAAQARVARLRPGVTWLTSVGLDRHAPLLGLERLAGGARPAPLADPAGLTETIFAPIGARVHHG